MNTPFFARPTPVIAAIFAGQSPDELIGKAQAAEADGADAIAIDLEDFRPEFRDRASMRRIIGSVKLPVMLYFYRTDRHNVTHSDEERQPLLLLAAEAGASMIDVMGDLYDPSYHQCTRNPQAIERQMKLIDQLHDRGAQVVMSSHVTDEAVCPRDVLEQLQSFERRGADVVKIVTQVETEAQYADAIDTLHLLHRKLKKPFICLANGKYSRQQRLAGLHLGIGITFAVHKPDSYAMTQPSLADMLAERNTQTNIPTP